MKIRAESVFISMDDIARGVGWKELFGRAGIDHTPFEIYEWGPVDSQFVKGFWVVDRSNTHDWMGQVEGLQMVQQIEWKDFVAKYEKWRSDAFLRAAS